MAYEYTYFHLHRQGKKANLRNYQKPIIIIPHTRLSRSVLHGLGIFNPWWHVVWSLVDHLEHNRPQLLLIRRVEQWPRALQRRVHCCDERVLPVLASLIELATAISQVMEEGTVHFSSTE